jgi:4-carboxymuconolactone decarboxylase
MAGPAIFCSRANGSVRISRHATSLVTVSTLIASGQVAQVTYRLNCALDNGLTKPQTPEVLTHLAFDAGWQNVFSAVPAAEDASDKRAR